MGISDRSMKSAGGEPVGIRPRPLPVETLHGLRPPLAGFPWFRHADRFPLKPATGEYSAVNAWWLSDACFLSYGDAAFVQEAFGGSPLPDQSWQLGWVGEPGNNRGIVLSRNDVMVIVFRGTRLERHSPFDAAELIVINQDDLWVDSRFLPVVSRFGGSVHAGFLSAFSEISDDLDNILRGRARNQALILAGHSLGGALATLAATHADPVEVDALYTYGSPKVGNAGFAESVAGLRHFRHVCGEDWVPKLPPAFLGYVHTGQLMPVPGVASRGERREWYDSASELFSGLTAMAKAGRVDVGDLPFRIAGLVHHAPVCYATLLFNALPGIRR